MSASPILFSAYAEQWASLTLPMRKPATAATQRSHVSWFSRPEVLGSVPVREMDWATTQRAFTACRSECSPKTLRNRWSTLRLVLEQARMDGHITVVSTPTLPRNPRKAQPFFTAEQMRLITRSVSGDLHVFCCMLAETGARIAEMIGVQPQDFDLAKRTLHIQRDVYRGADDTVKTNAADRKLSLSSSLAEKLAPLLRSLEPTAYVFHTRNGTPWWPTEVQKLLNQVMEDHKIPRAAFHAWRRGNITLAGKILGMPEPLLAQRVGHTLPSLTFGLYTHEVDGYDREWAERISAHLS
jgi:integrase